MTPTGSMSVATSTDPRPRVVIIDDTADLRELLRLALTRGGYDVVGEAGDGQRGIDVVRELSPDAILLDLAMPVMDGISALPVLRELVPDAKIVVLSGFGTQQVSSQAMRAGADGYVQKGTSLASVLAQLDDVVAGRGTRPVMRSAGFRPTVGELPPKDATLGAERTSSARSSDPTDGARLDAASDSAPFGIVELADESMLRIRALNPKAAELLADATPHEPLATVAPELAGLVSFHRAKAEAGYDASLNGERVHVQQRRRDGSLYLYLDSAAREADLLRRAISVTAHELRSPVTVINGIAEMMPWSERPQDPDLRLLNAVSRQARIIDRITADLLTATQVHRGALHTDIQSVDVSRLLTSVVELNHDLDIQLDITPGTAQSVQADPIRLEQMLTNLLSNAHKYGAEPVFVTAESRGDQVHIAVADSGEGVPEDFEHRLFSEFARADGTPASGRAVPGNGLGLYVVRTLARAQGGDISYARRDPNGSVFTLRLRAG